MLAFPKFRYADEGAEAPPASNFTPELRLRLIEQEAFFLAQERYFSSEGFEEDWLLAEAAIDALSRRG